MVETIRSEVRAVIVAEKAVKAAGAKDGRKMNSKRYTAQMVEIVSMKTGHTLNPTGRPRWVERAVWTDRMLQALENGVIGGKWHNLIDKVYARRNLDAACQKVLRNKGAPGIDRITVDAYIANQEHYQATVAQNLHTHSYRPKPLRRVSIDKPGTKEKRPLGIPCLRDRIVQGALKNVLEPIFENGFHPDSYGFRPERSCHDALRQVDQMIKSGYQVVVDADIRGFFDAIPKDKLMDMIRRDIADGRVLDLLELLLNQGIMEGMRYWEPETGTPQGGVISPLLANIFLNDFDWAMSRQGIRFVRYADDFVLLCRNRADAEKALELAKHWMDGHGLELHPEKTKIVDMSEHKSNFSFLGYCFKRNINRRGESRILRLISRKSLSKLRATLRIYTKRVNAHSMPEIIRRINQTLKGWFPYFKHLLLSELRSIDQYIRRRLRRILRKRSKRSHGSGISQQDHQRWPNAYFNDLGYFSLEAAHQRTLQSLRGTH